MPDPLLVYGATGHTGRLIARQLLQRGIRPRLGGRDGAALAAMADELGLPFRVASLRDPAQLDAALSSVRAVLHCAGPFDATAGPMLAACLRTGAHYLDITGELPVLAELATRDGAARQRGIMIMPGVGFDVVPSDCLAAHVARRLPGADHLAIGIKGLVWATRGSAKTMAAYAGIAPVVRRNGALAALADRGLERHFDYGDGPQRSLCVPWGDVVAAYHTTGIPNVEVYFDALPMRELLAVAGRTVGRLYQLPVWQTWLRTVADLLPADPGGGDGGERRLVIVAEASRRDGRRATARLRTPEAYHTTAMTAAAVAARVLGGDLEPGVQTPGRVYGPDFVLGIPGVAREDLA